MTVLSNRHPPSPPGWQVWHDSGSILDIETVTGRIAAGGYQGLAWYDLDGTRTEIDPPVGESWQVRALLATGSGRLLVGHAAGLSIIDPDGTIQQAGWPDDQACQVECLEPFRDGVIVVGTTSGVYVTDETSPGRSMTLTIWDDAACLASSRVFDCLLDSWDGLWCGTYNAPAGGVSYWDGTGWRHWTMADGLPHADITSLLETADGSVWAGCGFKTAGGAARFARGETGWELVETLGEDELAGPKVRSIFEDSRGWVWFGSEEDGLVIRHDGETRALLTQREGLPHLEIMSYLEAADGAVWIGTLNGLARIERPVVDTLLSATGS